MNLNKALLIGYLTRDPEIRYLTDGTPVCDFGMATNYQTKTRKETEFHNLTAFGSTAERIAEFLVKGSLCYIEGRLRTESWERDTIKHSRTKIMVERVVFSPKSAKDAEALPERDPGEEDDIQF